MGCILESEFLQDITNEVDTTAYVDSFESLEINSQKAQIDAKLAFIENLMIVTEKELN